jgi:predicted permease
VIPLAAVIGAATAAGFGAEHRFRAAADDVARRLLQIVLWVLMPVIAFFNIASLHLTASVGAGIGFGYVAMVATLSLAYALGRYVLRLPRAGIGALMCVAAFANTGYLGLPFTAALFGFDDVPNAVAYDALVSGVTFVTVGFSIGAWFGDGGEHLRERIWSFFARNPPLWASALGLIAPAALAPSWAVDASRVLVVLILPIGFFAVGVTLAA